MVARGCSADVTRPTTAEAMCSNWDRLGRELESWREGGREGGREGSRKRGMKGGN